MSRCYEIIGEKTISVIGYGPQARSQSLNLRDNGFNVIIGSRDGESYLKALSDGWKKNVNLFSIEEAARRGNIVQYLLSDVGQIKQWPIVSRHLTAGKTLYFSHGFGIAFSDQTNINTPDNIDVIMVAPKGAGMTVRDKYLEGKGINVSYAVHNDATGSAKHSCLALAFGIGCGNAFETTFKKEVYSDLVGERCVLMGMIQGAFSAQYKVLREKGHSPLEAYNETVEEALVSLYPLINDKGMDWLYSNCSSTAQRGALDWAPVFEKTLKPIINDCYESVANGTEVRNTIRSNSTPNYRKILDKELNEIDSQELWVIARKMRELRY
jgi:ketol-acid reductoisomerase